MADLKSRKLSKNGSSSTRPGQKPSATGTRDLTPRPFGSGGSERRTAWYSAMKMYNDKAMLTQRESLENWQGWEYKPIKRNGRKQNEHLRRARAVQAIDYPDGEWRNKKGAPTAEQTVREWQEQHPDGKKVDCARDTGLSRTTVTKWWN